MSDTKINLLMFSVLVTCLAGILFYLVYELHKKEDRHIFKEILWNVKMFIPMLYGVYLFKLSQFWITLK